MSKIYVIGTVHEEGGACTSDELMKIINKISPKVIFCEASPETFPAMLKATKSFNTPEIKVLRIVTENHSIDAIPIDLFGSPSDRRLEAMLELFRSKISEYFYAMEIHAGEAYRLGFPYLNSEDSDQIHKDKSSMEGAFVSKVNHYPLSQTYMDWLRWNDKRENHWINQICDFFKKGTISTAVLLVGSAHRVRLMEKVKNLQNNELILDWDFYPFR